MTSAIQLTDEEEAYYLELANKFEKASKGIVKIDDVFRIGMTDHAYKVVSERFDIHDRSTALSTFRSYLKDKAIYLCETVDENDNRTHTFGIFVGKHHAASIHLDLALTTIVTVIKLDVSRYPMPEKIKNKTMKMYRAEIDRLTSKEKQLIEKVDCIVEKANAETFPLRLELMQTTNEKRKESIIAALVKIDKRVAVKREELIKLQKTLRYIARSMITMM